MKSIVDYTNKLKDFFASKQALTNVKNGTSDINQTTSSGCTITNGIKKGTYFYLDGVLVRAKQAISNGDSFTSSNYEVPTAGALNELNTTFNDMFKVISGVRNEATLPANGVTAYSLDDMGISIPTGYSVFGVRSYSLGNTNILTYAITIPSNDVTNFWWVSNITSSPQLITPALEVIMVKTSLFTIQ